MELSRAHQIDSLEALRGIAAVIVVLFHIGVSFFPYAFFGPAGSFPQHSRFEDNFFGSPFFFFVNGSYAVALFFILSGFVLSIGYFSANNKEVAQHIILKQSLKRYFRLAIPAGVSVLIAYVLIALSLNMNHEAFAVTGSERLAMFWSLEPDISDAIKQGFYGIFKGEYSYNPVLWTMQWEFIGSFLVFAFLTLFGHMRVRYLLYVLMIIAASHSYLLGFIIGIVIADLYAHNKIKLKNNKTLLAMVPTVIILGAYPIGSTDNTAYELLSKINSWNFMWYMISATMLMLIILRSKKVNQMLSSKKISFIGKHTFSMYVLHDLIILTIVSALIVSLSPHVAYWQLFIICFIVLALVLIPAILFYTRYVDQTSVFISRWAADKAILLDQARSAK